MPETVDKDAELLRRDREAVAKVGPNETVNRFGNVVPKDQHVLNAPNAPNAPNVANAPNAPVSGVTGQPFSHEGHPSGNAAVGTESDQVIKTTTSRVPSVSAPLGKTIETVVVTTTVHRKLMHPDLESLRHNMSKLNSIRASIIMLLNVLLDLRGRDYFEADIRGNVEAFADAVLENTPGQPNVPPI